MGEASRRAKLDPNFGQKYPAKDENWVFTSASDEVAIGSLKECLSMAGITTRDDYRDQYIKPLTEEHLSDRERSELVTSIYLDRRTVNDQQYQILFKQAVKTGSTSIVLDDDYPDECCHRICYNPERAEHFRNHGY